MSDDLQARLEQALRERDEALADGARVAEVLQKACDSLFATGHDRLAERYQQELLNPHPGAALLREVLALRRVREAAQPFHDWEVNGVDEPTQEQWDTLSDACAAADAAREKTNG